MHSLEFSSSDERELSESLLSAEIPSSDEELSSFSKDDSTADEVSLSDESLKPEEQSSSLKEPSVGEESLSLDESASEIESSQVVNENVSNSSDTSLPYPSSQVFIEGGFFFKRRKRISPMILGILLGIVAFILLILIIVFIIVARKTKDEKNTETEKQSEVETISGSENIKTEFENPLFENNFMQNDPFLHAMIINQTF